MLSSFSISRIVLLLFFARPTELVSVPGGGQSPITTGCRIFAPLPEESVHVSCSEKRAAEGSLAMVFSFPDALDVGCRDMLVQAEVDGTLDEESVQTIPICPLQNNSWVGRGVCVKHQIYFEGDHELRLDLHDTKWNTLYSCTTLFKLEIIRTGVDVQDVDARRAVVTGASSNHFASLRNFVRNGLPGYTGAILVYDLGLTRAQRDEAKAWPSSEFRSFPFHAFPPHVSDLMNYAWKPLIIFEALQEFRVVVWMDAGTLIESSDRLSALFSLVEQLGFFAPVTWKTLIGDLTYPAVMQRFQAHPWHNASMLTGGLNAFNRASAAYAAIAIPYRDCAVVKECIAPDGSDRSNHRQDQSILSILAQRSAAVAFPFAGVLYNQDMDFGLSILWPADASQHVCASPQCYPPHPVTQLSFEIRCPEGEPMCWGRGCLHLSVNGEDVPQIQLPGCESLWSNRYPDSMHLPPHLLTPGANFVTVRITSRFEELVAEASVTFTLLAPSAQPKPPSRSDGRDDASPPARAAGPAPLPAFHLLEVPAAACTLPSAGCSVELPPPHASTALPRSRPAAPERADSDGGGAGSGCPPHSEWFLGACACHAHYAGEHCERKEASAVDELTGWGADGRVCANWEWEDTVPMLAEPEQLWSGECGLAGRGEAAHPLYCAVMCLSHASYGAALAPTLVWEAAQAAETAEWNDSWLDGDRVAEHQEGFGGYACAPDRLGHVLEMGAGPWTQTRGMLAARPDLEVSVESLTVFDPAADFYANHVPTCAYSSMRELKRLDGGTFSFPLRVLAYQGEQLSGQSFDTVVSINVLEHVQDAFAFLSNLHAALRPGGTLIFHERYYEDSVAAAMQIGYRADQPMLHPIRVRRRVLDWLLADMDILYNNCNGHGGRQRGLGEQGYYVIARKRGAAAGA